MKKKFLIFLLAFGAISPVLADHETILVWRLANGSGADVNRNFDSPEQVCDFYKNLVADGRPFIRDENAFLNDEVYSCRLFFDSGKLRNGKVEEDFESNTAISRLVAAEHDQCELQVGTVVKGEFEVEGATSRVCENSCLTDIVHQVQIDENNGVTTIAFVGVTTDAVCDVGSNNQPRNQKRFGESENVYIDEQGVETTYSAPDNPPEDVDPNTDGDQAPEVIGSTSSTDGALTVTEFQMQGGGTILVVTDENGNVEFTDSNPITGSGQYGQFSGSGGDTSGGTTDGGTTSGGESNGGGSDDGDDNSDDDEVVTGGASCDSRPVCSGSAINCAILNQAWENRCEVEQLNDMFEEEVPIDDFANSDGAKDIESMIEEVGDDLGDFDGATTAQLIESGDLSGEARDQLRRISLEGGCNFQTLNTSLYGATFDAGTGLCEAIEPYRQTAGFVLWVMTVFGIWTLFMNSIGRSF